MDKNFLFDAPTFLDFNLPEENGNSSNLETYFDIDHEFTPKTNSSIINAAGPTPDTIYSDIDHEFTPSIINSVGPTPDTIYSDILNQSNIKKSASFVDLTVEEEATDPHNKDTLVICEEQPSTLRRSISAGNLLIFEDSRRKNVRNSRLVKKSNFQDRINELAQPKQLAQPKYVSTAEQINKFYGTPTRFHSWQKNGKISNHQYKPLTNVIPESPALATKFRSRHNNVLSKDEIEKQEMEEFKRFKIKARPVNPKILRGPIKPIDVPKKPSTVVKPFNLSENPSKKTEGTSENVENYEFHARPVPKAIYRRSDSETKLQQKQKQNVIMSGSQEKLQIRKVESSSIEKSFKSTKPIQTLPVPFSFEKRDQQLIKRREALINKVLEEEKQAREFRAKPVPKFIPKKSASLNNLKTIKAECDSSNPPQVFKAKPPTVLYQKPFEPKKPERVLTEVTDVCLNTDRRAKEREDFDKKQQEKRERMAVEKLRREILQTQYAEEEVARLRKQAVHTAQPIRNYKEFKIEPSGKVTTPVTPNFKTSQRAKMHNKENN